jgi:hypothetical protein
VLARSVTFILNASGSPLTVAGAAPVFITRMAPDSLLIPLKGTIVAKGSGSFGTVKQIVLNNANTRFTSFFYE